MWAARNGHEGTVRRLAEGGADLKLKNGDGASAAMVAIYNDRFDMAATLVELGSDVDDGSLYVAVEMRDSTTDQFAFDGSRLRPNHPS
jgi:ankyrin repeat protein